MATADYDWAISQLWPISLFYGCVKGVAVHMGDGEMFKLVMNDQPGR
jgi:hypothetical protein